MKLHIILLLALCCFVSGNVISEPNDAHGTDHHATTDNAVHNPAADCQNHPETCHGHAHDNTTDHAHHAHDNATDHAHHHVHDNTTDHAHEHAHDNTTDHSHDHAHDNTTDHAHHHAHDNTTDHAHHHAHDNTTDHAHHHAHDNTTDHAHDHAHDNTTDHAHDHAHDNTADHAHDHTHDNDTVHGHDHGDGRGRGHGHGCRGGRCHGHGRNRDHGHGHDHDHSHGHDHAEEAAHTLHQLHIIFRHGDRAPVNLYPTDPNQGHVWEFGTGQLTNIGKRQQYELGTFLRHRYNHFLSTDPREIEVRSSDKDRTIASTQVNLAAFFRPEGKWVWNSNLIWQPIPIHTRPKAEDWVLNEDADCEAAEREGPKILTSPQGVAFLEKYHDLMALLQTNGGMTVNDPISLLDIFGTIFIERLKGLEMPSWMNDNLWHQMEEAADEAFVVMYSCRKIQRLRGGPLINHFTELMKSRAAATADSNPKAYMYSTHDAIIAAVMSAMGVFNNHTVPYCATLLVELHQLQPSGEHVVRLFYRNGTVHEPFPLHVPGCEVDCPLTQFTTLLEGVTPHDIKAECHAPAESVGEHNEVVHANVEHPEIHIAQPEVHADTSAAHL